MRKPTFYLLATNPVREKVNLFVSIFYNGNLDMYQSSHYAAKNVF